MESLINPDLTNISISVPTAFQLVDDLDDTGRTARLVRDMLPNAHFAMVYAKPEGRPLVDTFITEVSQDTWILFPWGTEIQFVKPIASGT